MKRLAIALLCWMSVPVFAQKEYIPDEVIDIGGQAGDFTISNYYTKKVYAWHLKVDDIVSVYNGLIGFRLGDKYGFADFHGKIVRPAEFDPFDRGEGSYPFENRGDYMAVRKGELTGLIDSLGNYAIPLGDYGYLWDAGKGTCAAELDGKFGLFRNGKCILPMEYDSSYDNFEFTHDIMPVFKDDLCGFINSSGKFVLPLEYSEVSELEEAGWTITKNELTGFVDFKGKTIVPCSLQSINRVYDGLVYATKDDLYGIQKMDGTIVCPYAYNYLTDDPVDGVVFAKKDDLWGILSLKNPGKTQFLYSNYAVPSWNKSHLASLRKDNKVGLVNTTGEVIFDFVLDEAYESMNFQYGLAIVAQNGLYGMMSESGKLLIPCEFDDLNLYSNFPQIARKKGKYGVVDLNGKTLVPFEYDEVTGFDYDQYIYIVNKHNKRGLYHVTDGLIVPVEYDNISKNRGFYQVSKDGKTGFYNEYGKIALPCLFSEILDFTPSTALVSKNGVLQQYDLLTANEQTLTPDSVIRFETTSFLNFGKTYVQTAGWEDGFAKNAETGKWYCVDNNTNTSIGKPYYAMGLFNEQGNVAVSTEFNALPFAINSKGEEIKPHFYLDQGMVFGVYILDNIQDSIIYQFQKRDLLKNVKPEDYGSYIESNYVVLTVPDDLYDPEGNAVGAYYLSCFDKSSYFNSETAFPAKPQYAYRFSDFYSRWSPANEAGWHWAVTPESDYNPENHIDMNTTTVVLVNDEGEVLSKPNYNPVQSVPFFNIVSDLQFSWEELEAYPYIIDSIQPFFPEAASLSYGEFLRQYKDSVYTEIIPVYNYSEYEESVLTYAHSFYKKSSLQLFHVPPPANIEYRFVINDIQQVKGGESFTQPDDTHLFRIDRKTAYSFGNKHYFAYPVMETGTSPEDTKKRISELIGKTQSPHIKSDLQRFDYFTGLIAAGLTTREYIDPDSGRTTYNVEESYAFEVYSYPASVGLAIENEVFVQPDYLAIAFDPEVQKFILVDSLFRVFSFDPEKRKTTALKDFSYCATGPDGLILRSKKTTLFDVFYPGVHRADINGPYLTELYPERCIKNAKRLYFLQNCNAYPLSNMYGEDSIIVHEDGVVEYPYYEYCDTLVASIYRPAPPIAAVKWYELEDGTIYKFSGEKETTVHFSDYLQHNLPLNEDWLRDFSMTETSDGIDLKNNTNRRTLHLSDKEYRAVAWQTDDQNGFGGIFRKGKFIPYSTMTAFPEKHSVYIHLQGPFWLIGEENALELVYLDVKTNQITHRYPEKFTSMENFREKRREIPANGEEVNAVEIFMMMK